MKDLKSEVREVLSKTEEFVFRLFGTKDYVQILIEPGIEVGNWKISEWCEKFECCSSVSCMNCTGKYYLMIELYR